MTLREYSIDYSNPEEAAKTTLRMFIDQLISYRGTSPKPDELEWEIRVYEFMLNDPSPATRLRQYQEARAGKYCTTSGKRDAVSALGLVIP